MRAFIPAFLFLLVLASAGCTEPPFETDDSLDAFTGHLDVRVPKLMAQYGVPGLSMALVRDGQLVWTRAYGYADLEQGRKMTVETVFRVESLSKPVTAWGVLNLVEQGLIGLDDPVERYLNNWELPASEYPVDGVTVRRLLSNTAGMRLGTIGEEYPPMSEMPTLREYLAREARLVQEPGLGFLYSNTGFDLLELLVQEVTNRDFAEHMATEVLTPLGMKRASFSWDEVFRDAVAVGYDLQGEPVPVYVTPAKASGGLFADVRAIARFVRAGMTGVYSMEAGVLENGSIDQLHSPEVDIPGLFGVVADAYGLGHFIETLSDGRRAVWHGGQGHGLMTHFHAVPESGDAIVILTNSQRSWPVMAQVLADWGRWNGFGAVKMSRITYGVTALRWLIVIVWLVSLWQVLRLVRGVRRGGRRFAPLSGDDRNRRLMQTALGAAVIGVVTWAAVQPYLMVSSVFPGIAGQFGLSLVILAAVMVLSAGFPFYTKR